MKQDKDAEKTFFDSFAAENLYDVFDDRGYERLIREFLALVKPSRDEKLLDLGCGTGAFTERLAFRELRITGIDISFNNVAAAAVALPESTFIVSDAEQLPFPENTFGIVTFSGMLHHLPDLDKALVESRRVLKPGGRIFAYDPNGRNPAMWFYRNPRSPFHSREGWTVNERLLRAEEVEACLVRAGFTNAISRGVSGIGYTYVRSQVVRRLLPVYNFLDRCLDRTPLSRRYGAFLISYAEKR